MLRKDCNFSLKPHSAPPSSFLPSLRPLPPRPDHSPSLDRISRIFSVSPQLCCIQFSSLSSRQAASSLSFSASSSLPSTTSPYTHTLNDTCFNVTIDLPFFDFLSFRGSHLSSSTRASTLCFRLPTNANHKPHKVSIEDITRFQLFQELSPAFRLFLFSSPLK